jgi:glycosyltransferase involved in cell wall biosynthesis
LTARPRFLLTFLAWSRGLSGGDRHLLEVAARWRADVDVEVLAPPEAEPLLREFLGDVRILALGSASGRRAAGGLALALEYVRRAVLVSLRRSPPVDVVVAASHFIPDAAALTSLTRRGAVGVSYVYHLLGERPGLAPRTLWSKADERTALALLRRSARVVFVSNAETEAALARRGFATVRTAVGVEVASFPHVVPGSLAPTGAFVARMARTKGVRDAVETWAHVRGRLPSAHLRMVGTGPEREGGMQFAEQLGIAEGIEWPGFVPEDEKRRILGESRVFVAPSYEEGWGIAVCEALASGVPVVAYRHPVLDELFGGAYVGVDAGDVEALAEHVIRVLEDNAYADELSNGGRAVARRYDVARVAEQELETILRVRCGS